MKEVLEILGKLGIGGGIGALIGLGMVVWVEPTTNGGVVLLIVISIIVCATITSILSKVLGARSNGHPSKESRTSDNQAVNDARK
jgi:hypothetical protein